LDRNGLKKSESGFDTNKTNPFLSISIHFVCWALKCSFKIMNQSQSRIGILRHYLKLSWN